MCARRRASPISPTAPRSPRPRPAPTKARFSRRCMPRSSPPAATIPATNSSSARAPTRCSAATRAGGASSSADDQLTLEFAGVSRHYHAAIMRTHVVGRREAAASRLSRRRARGAPGLRGRTAARPHRRRRLRRPCARLRRARPGAPPAQRLRLFARREVHAVVDGRADVLRGNAFVIAAGQVYFLHMILMDSDSATAMCLGRTYLVGVDGAEPFERGRSGPRRSNRVSRALTKPRGASRRERRSRWFASASIAAMRQRKSTLARCRASPLALGACGASRRPPRLAPDAAASRQFARRQGANLASASVAIVSVEGAPPAIGADFMQASTRARAQNHRRRRPQEGALSRARLSLRLADRATAPRSNMSGTSSPRQTARPAPQRLSSRSRARAIPGRSPARRR